MEIKSEIEIGKGMVEVKIAVKTVEEAETVETAETAEIVEIIVKVDQVIKESRYMKKEQIERLLKEFLILTVDCIHKKLKKIEGKKPQKEEKELTKEVQAINNKEIIAIDQDLKDVKNQDNIHQIADFIKLQKHKKQSVKLLRRED